MSKLLSQPQKNWGFSFDVNNILILLNYSNCIVVLFVPAWNIGLTSGVLPLILLFLIGLNQKPTSTLDPLSLHRKVASISLFYHYYFGHCSDELAACIPPPMARSSSTCQATFAHNYCVELSNARINRFSDGFFPSSSRLWNSLPSTVFPASFNLPSFKRQVYHHLRDQMACFFFLILLFLDILQNCFILYITLLFLFSKDADSRRGALCPFRVPINNKKKIMIITIRITTIIFDIILLLIIISL